MRKVIQFFKAIRIFCQLGPEKVIKLQEQVIRDPLTNLFNRRFLEEVGIIEVERAKRYRQPLSIVLLDIDGFKKINDTLGHLEGDRALKKVAKVVTSYCRKADIPVRWGGDEFMLVLPETTGRGAEQLIKRVTNDLGAEGIRLSYGVVP